MPCDTFLQQQKASPQRSCPRGCCLLFCQPCMFCGAFLQRQSKFTKSEYKVLLRISASPACHVRSSCSSRSEPTELVSKVLPPADQLELHAVRSCPAKTQGLTWGWQLLRRGASAVQEQLWCVLRVWCDAG